MAELLENSQEINFDFENMAISPDVPKPVDFDFNNITVEPDITEKVYFEGQDSVVELPGGGLSRIKSLLSGAYDKGLAGQELNKLYFRQLSGDESDAVKSRISNLKEIAGKQLGGLGTYEDFLRAGVEATPDIIGLVGNTLKRSAQGAAVGAGTGFLAGNITGIGAVLPEELITVPAGAAFGARKGGLYGAAEYSFIQNAGEGYGYITEMVDKSGVKFQNKDLARLGSVMIGASNAGLDLIPISSLSRAFVGKNILMDALKKNGAKSLVIPKGKEAIAKFIIDYARYIATESATEGLQEGVKTGIGELAKYFSDQEFEATSLDDVLSEIGSASAEAAKATATLGVAGGGAKTGVALFKKKTDGSIEQIPPAESAPKIEDQVGEKDTLIAEANTLNEIAKEAEANNNIELAKDAKMFAAENMAKANAIAEQQQRNLATQAQAVVEPIYAQQEKEKQKQLLNLQSEINDMQINILREVSAIQESKQPFDQETLSLLEQTQQVLKEKRGIAKPVGLTDFIKSIGGINDVSGELAALGMDKPIKGARNDNTGIDYDSAREAAAEAGYIDQDATVGDLLTALSADYSKQAVIVSQKDIGNQVYLDELDNLLAKLDESLSKKNITYNKDALKNIRQIVSKNKKLDQKISREIKTREFEITRLESIKAEAEKNPGVVLSDKLKTFLYGARKGGVLQRRETKDVQAAIINIIGESGITPENRSKFINTIKNTQTIEQMQKIIPDIIEKTKALAEGERRSRAISEIKKLVAKAEASNVISVDFVNKIKDVVSEIDLKKISPKKLSDLQATLDFMKRTPDAIIPSYVIKNLERLSKKPISEMSVDDIEAINNAIKTLVDRGKLKYKLLQAKNKRKVESALADIAKSAVIVADFKDEPKTIEVISDKKQQFQSAYISVKKKISLTNLSLAPMDVFFDTLDGAKNYKGAIYRTFKESVDKNHNAYLNLKDNVTKPIKDLVKKLDLDVNSRRRIGAWAALQQEGGRKKLIDSGYSEKSIDELKLNDQEMLVYNAMRDALDSMLPAIQKIMLDVYNVNVKAVGNYFPFITDFEAKKDRPIVDQLNPDMEDFRPKKTNAERGFTVERNLGIQAIEIDAVDVFIKHVNNAAYLIEMGETIKFLGKVSASDQYKKSVGEMAQEMTRDWVDLLARNGNVSTGKIHFLDVLRQNVALAILGLKLSTIFVQFTSLADGAAIIGRKYISNGIQDVTDKNWRKFLYDNFPEVRDRAGDDVEYLSFSSGSLQKLRRSGFWATKKIDSLVASAVAAGAYRKVIEDAGGIVDLTNADPVAIQQAQLLMRRSQSSAFAKDTPSILTQGKFTRSVSLDKLLFQFQSFMLNRWSVLKHDAYTLGIKDGNFKQAAETILWLAMANSVELGIRLSLPAAIALILGSKDEADEDDLSKKVIYTALGNVPFVSQAVSVFEYGSSPVPAISFMGAVNERIKWANASKSPEKKTQHYIEAFILAGGLAAGIPGTLQVEQIIRESMKKDMKNNRWGDSSDW